MILPLASRSPNITCTCLANIPIPIAANIPCIAEEGKKSPREPILRKPRITIIIPENTIAARVNKYP